MPNLEGRYDSVRRRNSAAIAARALLARAVLVKLRRSLEGEKIYEHRTVLWARSGWGKIVKQRVFYDDTQRLLDLDRGPKRGVESVRDRAAVDSA